MNSKKVTIIIPMYNSEKYVIKTLNSIKNQTYQNIEVIVVDDSSTDSSYEIVNKYIKNTKRNIKLLKQYNQNASVARNKGLEIATGDYVYFIDSDDEIYSDKTIEKMVSAIGKNDLLIGNYEIVSEDSKYISDYTINIKKGTVYDYSNVQPFPAAKLYNKKIIDKYNLYFSNVRIGQDLNFYLKYLCHTEKLVIFDEYISKYRIVSTSMSRKKGDLKFLDTFNSVNEIKKEYLKYNLDNEFNNYIVPVAISHYIGHLTKVDNFKKHYERKYVFNSIDFYIKSLLEGIKKNKNIKKQLVKYRIMKLLLKTRTYSPLKRILRKNKIK